MTVWGSDETDGRRRAGRGGARRIRAVLAGVALGTLGPLLAPAIGLPAPDARADFRVCNESTDTVGVAIGYYDGSDFVSEGWWHVDGEACETLVSGTLASRFYYVYAENAERSRRWGGEVRMCTAEDEFKIDGVKDCIARGFARMGFGEYDTGEEASWTVRLTAEAGDAANGTPPLAETGADPASATN